MPIYEYGCNDCGTEFEAWQKITATGSPCEKCGSENTTRRISATSFVLKGTGWYASDYGGKNGTAKTSESKSEGESSGSDAKSEPKADAKAETKSESKPESKPESSGGDAKKAASA